MKPIYRQALPADLPRLFEIYSQAVAYFREAGINQWQDGYPTKQDIQQDIDAQQGRVLEIDGQIVAVAALCYDEEPTYKKIYEGEWLHSSAYAAIHRVAVDPSCKGKGLAPALMQQMMAEAQARELPSVRIDTHRDNLSMQRMLEKTGFVRRGIIYLANGDERIAFEKPIDSRLSAASNA